MIICLRPQPDCDADVAELTRLDVQSVALPMLQVAYLSGPCAIQKRRSAWRLSGHHHN